MSRNQAPTSVGFKLGLATGWLVAPLFALTSFARRARTFHPCGAVFHASATPHGAVPVTLQPLAERLAGPALVRFSAALWKNAQRIPDVLGCAIRLRNQADDSAQPADHDQDLLFATIRRPWTMPFAPLTTDVRDYLSNDYFAVSPFLALDASLKYFRLHPVHPATDHDSDRDVRIAREVEHGGAVLELACSDSPFGPWTELLSVTLRRPAQIDGQALRFSPFRTGRGLRPYGFVHALRAGVYTLSQRARPQA
jgi:hypothetical protein